MNGTVLVLGGRSEIGLAVAERLVRRGARAVVLAARRADDLDREVATLQRAGATDVHRVEFDADDIAGHHVLLDKIVEQHGTPDIVITAFGILGDQARAEREAEHALDIVHTDYVAHVSILTHLANLLRAKG
ncbi:MAG TPA: SDR family NAD(P)-dependent oxidoreductase, partial [Pseudonocardiaceae bacterium]|nr:SDR family NAD(P)-dependent oxidoreductase [Pseudonocardiaceae bacterium]